MLVLASFCALLILTLLFVLQLVFVNSYVTLAARIIHGAAAIAYLLWWSTSKQWVKGAAVGLGMAAALFCVPVFTFYVMPVTGLTLGLSTLFHMFVAAYSRPEHTHTVVSSARI